MINFLEAILVQLRKRFKKNLKLIQLLSLEEPVMPLSSRQICLKVRSYNIELPEVDLNQNYTICSLGPICQALVALSRNISKGLGNDLMKN